MATETNPAADLPTSTLGSLAFTWQNGRWAAERFDVVIDGQAWTVSLTLDGGRVSLYAYNSDGDNLHGPMTYAPTLTVQGAIRNAIACS